MRRSHAFYGCAVAALGLAACSGGGGGGSVPNPGSGATAVPVLIPGTSAQYRGTDSIVHVYPMPTGTQSNYTAGYSFTTTRTVSAAAAGAPAAFDINAQTTYTVVQDPGQGITHVSDTTDTYENQSAVSGGTLVQSVGSKAVTSGIDESAGAGGGGPFTQTQTTTTSYTNPQTVGVYPLATGATIAEPIARRVLVATTDANGGVTETANVFDASSTDDVNADGSYALSEQLSNGEAETVAENANGSGAISANGPLYTLSQTIGVPTSGGTGYTIPVTSLRQNATTGATPAPTATTMAYAAADWYPGGGLPVTPFQTSQVTVKGPVSTLPSACSAAIAEPNLVEVDTNDATLNIDASTSTTVQQRFESGGTPVCVLRTVTTNAHALTTGATVQTTTETYVQTLTSLTAPASAARTAPFGKS